MNLVVWLLLCSISFAGLIDQRCLDRFASLVKPELGSQIEKVPVFDLIKNEHKIEAAFEIARQTWKQRAETQKLMQALKEIQANSNLAKSHTSLLKEKRKWASILRSMFDLLDETHSSPEVFDEFTKHLGKLNDSIANEGSDISQLAKKTKNALLQLEGKKLKLDAASVKSIAHRQKETASILIRILGNKSAFVKDLHELRKRLKEFLAYEQAMLAIEEDPKNKVRFAFLFAINEKLGLVNDSSVGQAIKGKADYDTATTSISPDLFKDLQNLAIALNP